jgi:DNA modification methylase
MTQLTILQGDCLEVLPTLPAGSIQCCVTSPPYFGLRDYGTAAWEGGEEGCDHVMAYNLKRDANGGMLPAGEGSRGTQLSTKSSQIQYRDPCGKCGARRIDSQLGLEATPQEYVANMVAVFREVWRVLRDDGTLWLNLGDSYNANQGKGFDTHGDGGIRKALAASPKLFGSGLRPKNLVGIPWRVAFALQADGWYLRSDIIWHKPNPMPESVTDRPTKAHEYLFLLTKSERYFYDAEAIWEGAEKLVGKVCCRTWNYEDESSNPSGGGFRGDGGLAKRIGNGFRNKRSVWTIATQPYSEAHFATFPEDLVKPCILAGSRPGDTVLDPFAGSGTTGKVAIEFGRRALLIELNPDYIELARIRTWTTPGMF